MKSLVIFASCCLLLNISNITFAQRPLHHKSQSNNPDGVAINYLKWYVAHQDKDISRFYFFKNRNSNDTTLKESYRGASIPYKVNFEAVNKFLNQQQSSGFVSDFYLDQFRDYFQKFNEWLSYKSKEGCDLNCALMLRDYIEPDIVFRSIDYMDITDNVGKMKVISEKVKYTEAIIYISVHKRLKIRFTLSKYYEKWKINTIDYLYTN